MPNSSPATEKTKSVCASGMICLIDALARPEAEPVAVDHRLAAHVDLERIALAGQEAVDAAGDVREHRVGADGAGSTEAADAR